MTYGILPNGKQQFIDSNGKPLASGKVYYYIPSTTTFKNTYQNSAGTVLNTNPVVLDANGQCIAYGTGSYRQQVYDVYGNLVWDVQVDSPLTSGNQTYDIEEQTFTATSGQTVFTLTTMSYVPGTNNLVVFVDGLKQIVGVNYTETSATVVTFTTGLHVGAVVDFTTAVLQTNANIVPATDVTYNQGGTGAVTTTVQAKLQESVSVKDFGAKGDGSTDDTAAINNAIAYLNSTTYGGMLLLPTGTYNVTSINASNFGPDYAFGKNLRIVGEGINSSRIVGIQAGAIVLDCIGSNNIELEEFTIGTYGVIAQTGLLLARSTVSQNCNGSRIKNLNIQGQFSKAACVAIAAESSVWYSPRFCNTESTGNYTAFITSNKNNIGIVSTNGTIFPSSNTDNTMFKPTFFEPYGGSVVAIRFQGQAGYDIYSGFVVSGASAGGVLCQYEVDPGTGIFLGDVVWHNSLFEGQSPTIHYLVGDAGTAQQYFYGIKQRDGFINHYDATSFNLMSGNPASSYYNLYNSELTNIRYSSGITAMVTLYSSNNCILRLNESATGASILNVSGYALANGVSDITTSTWNIAQNVGVPLQSYGSATPTSGTYPKNFIVWNTNPTSGGYIGWVCTTGGTPGTWKTFGLIS